MQKQGSPNYFSAVRHNLLTASRRHREAFMWRNEAYDFIGTPLSCDCNVRFRVSSFVGSLLSEKVVGGRSEIIDYLWTNSVATSP